VDERKEGVVPRTDVITNNNDDEGGLGRNEH
jgi:hypothetical protein